jgi:hypothetical protein
MLYTYLSFHHHITRLIQNLQGREKQRKGFADKETV